MTTLLAREIREGADGIGISSEKAFSDLWERSLDLRPIVVDGDGARYEVVFPGVRNQGPGPDFLGAVLKRDGETFGGDVELHLERSGWRAHGHHKDPAYNGVALQVVLRPGGAKARRSDPPTATATFPDAPAGGGDAGATERATVSDSELEELGVRRFLSKSAGFRLELDAGIAPDQVLYEGMMEAMGYPRNRKPFLALAKRVPVSGFARLRGEPESAARFAVFAALAVGGGLSERVEPTERGQARRVALRMGVRREVRADEWSMFRVRPSGSPVNRMRGMADIVVRHLEDGLAEGMRFGVRARRSGERREVAVGRGGRRAATRADGRFQRGSAGALRDGAGSGGTERGGYSRGFPGDAVAAAELGHSKRGGDIGGAEIAGQRGATFGAARAG